MEKATACFSVVCCIALSAACLAWGGGNRAISISEKQIPAGNSIVYVEGAEAEPPLWPENASLPNRPATAQAAVVSMQMASAEKSSLANAGQPLRHLTGSSITVGKTPAGETVMIVWDR